MTTTTTTTTKIYKSDRDYIIKHISYNYYGDSLMSGTFIAGNGYSFSYTTFKEGRGTKGIIVNGIVDMVLSSGAPVRGFYLD